jgi:GTP cyclohydrolase II
MSPNYQVARTPLQTAFGEFEFYCFSWGGHEEDNILCQHKTPYRHPKPLVRVQSACYTAEIFRSTDCDCHAQLARSLRCIQAEGGLLIYMLCDGRGAGLLNKTRGLALGHTHGLDTSDAYRSLGLEQDPRTYDRVVEVLRYFGVQRLRLLTNNPRKVSGLTSGGLDVEREPLEVASTEASRSYLQTKARKMGHMLQQFRRTSSGVDEVGD